MIILGKLFGLSGLLYAGPVADGLAFILASVFLIKEVRNLRLGKTINKEVNIENNELKVSSQEQAKGVNNNFVITIAREYGSGGRYIGKLVAEKLGIKLYDKEIISEVAKKTGFSKDYIENAEQKKSTIDIANDGYYYQEFNNSDELFIKESELIREKANEESCVIVGRCANFILKDYKNTLNIFIYSDIESEIKRATKYYGLDEENAAQEINRINKLRSNHYKYYTETDWKSPSNYDICINSDALGVEKSAELIYNLVKKEILEKM